MCLKSGALVFGSGLAIIPLLEVHAVREHHWLTASAVHGRTGARSDYPWAGGDHRDVHRLHRRRGAGSSPVATTGIFLPSFLNIFYVLPRVWGRISKSPYTPHFTAFAIPAVIGAILATTFRLGAVSLISVPARSAFYRGRFAFADDTPIPGWVLILGSGAVGYFLPLSTAPFGLNQSFQLFGDEALKS